MKGRNADAPFPRHESEKGLHSYTGGGNESSSAERSKSKKE